LTEITNINKIKKLLHIVGTPFNESDGGQEDKNTIYQLYQIAQKNKIGLLFLESLSKIQDLDGLEPEMKKQKEAFNNIRMTAKRVASVLNESNCKYVMIKSNYVFHAVPSDTDILTFGGKEEYSNALEYMKKNKFKPVEDPVPLESCLHDTSRGSHINDHTLWHASKDPLDADVYREIGAGHVIYINKNELVDNVSEIDIDGTRISVFTPPTELIISIFHSIFPEKIYTLLLHFHILYTVSQMKPEEMREFIQICNKQKMNYAVLATLSLTERIQEICFGESPEKLTNLRKALGKKQRMNIDKIPYNYSTWTVLKSFWGKKGDPVFTKSFTKQLISMLNPKYARYVIRVGKERISRDTY